MILTSKSDIKVFNVGGKLQSLQSPFANDFVSMAWSNRFSGRKTHLGSALSELRSLLLRRAAGD